MENKLLIKIIYVLILLTSIVMGEVINSNFLYISKTIFWSESILLILVSFVSLKKRAKNWKYSNNFHLCWNVIAFIFSIFFIAYKGWFILLAFYFVGQIIGLVQYNELNKLVEDKDSTND